DNGGGNHRAPERTAFAGAGSGAIASARRIVLDHYAARAWLVCSCTRIEVALYLAAGTSTTILGRRHDSTVARRWFQADTFSNDGRKSDRDHARNGRKERRSEGVGPTFR